MGTQSSAQIAVHIVTYNNEQTIIRCLQSLEEQTIAYDLCIVDNASHDATIEVIHSLGYPIIQNQINRGYSAAHNQAIQQTTAPYILTLNPDVRLTPNFLEQMVLSFEEQPNVGAQAGLIFRVDDLDEEAQYIDSCGLSMEPNQRQRLRYEGCSYNQAPKHPEPIFGPDGAAAVYRRSMLESISINDEVFDEDFFIQKEDVDICWRAAFSGWDALFIPDAQAYHIRSFRPGQRTNVDARLRWYAVRNRYLLLIKHWRSALFLRYILSILLYDLAILVYLILFERESLSGVWDAIRLSKRMNAKRDKIRKKQLIPDRSLASWFHIADWC